MVKRLSGVLAALVLVLGVTACGSDEAAPQTPGNADGAPCAYPASGQASRDVDPPADTAAYDEGVEATITTNVGAIGLTLDAAAAPCTVNSFTSLASQGFYDDDTCPRVTTNPMFGVLQCGSGNGSTGGGPGYSFADELTGQETYPAGTVAMANSGPDTNGSQFFLVFNDTRLDPLYTVFGTIDDAGLEVLKTIAAKGTSEGTEDGTPAEPVEVSTITIGDETSAPPAPTTPAPTAYEPASSCTYTEDGSGSAKLPPETPQATDDVDVAMATTSGPIAMTLDGAQKPCTVNSFLSLAEQGYYDEANCPRVTTGGIFVLQCGRPTDPSTPGPGYFYDDELDGTETYPAGTVAMANPGVDANGGEFFLVYRDSKLDPNYTVFGTMSPAALRTVRTIARGGVQGGGPDGSPATSVDIRRIDVR